MSLFIIGTANNKGNWSISAKPHVHADYESAIEEATRLTLLHASEDKNFIVFEIKAETRAEVSCNVTEYE